MNIVTNIASTMSAAHLKMSLQSHARTHAHVSDDVEVMELKTKIIHLTLA